MSADVRTDSPPWAGLRLDRLDALQQRIFDAAYALGIEHGIRRGYELAEADMSEAWAPVARSVQGLSRTPTFEHLLARRRVDRDDVRPMPTAEECRRSWMPALAEYARRHGASEQDVAALVIAEGVAR